MRHSRLLQHLVRSIFPVTVLLSVLWGNGLESIVQDRSGNVALPRVKVVLASAALLVADGADERSAVRRALWRSSVVAIVVDVLTGRDEVQGTVGEIAKYNLSSFRGALPPGRHAVGRLVRSADGVRITIICYGTV